MPYIQEEDRKEIDKGLKPFITGFTSYEAIEPGCLNYIITRLLIETKPRSYRDYNKLIGVLECVKLEFYRRQIAVYEDEKKEKNGDVY
jgi:hypothetical protein